MKPTAMPAAVLIAALFAAPPSIAAPRPSADILHALEASARAWTAGDLDNFMRLYENAPTTSYVGGGRYVTGYQAIRDMYADRFGGGSDRMGALSLEMLAFRQLGPDYALVTGRYHLKREGAGPASGVTTLVFRRGAAGWRVISDTTP